MKEWKISDGIPTFLAVALLILLEAGRLSGLVSDSQLGRCEIICNAAMLLFVVIGLFFQPLVSKEKPSLSIGRIAGIIGVSLISFPMNISVFGYKIRPEHWVSDLWGWHLFWIACAVLNLMLLSALGRFLLAQGKLLFTQFRGILRWAKQIVVILGSSFLDILDYIRKSEKNILLTIIIGIFLWIACFVVPVIREGRPAVFADMRFWGKTLLYWVLYLFAALLVNIFPELLQKARNHIPLIRMKRVLIIITIASVLLVLVIAGPFLVKAICILLVLLTLLGDIIRRTYKIDKHKFSRPQQGNRQEQHNNGVQNEEVHGKKKLISVRVSDAIFFVLLFIIAPLATLFLFTLFTPAGRQLFPDGLSDPAAWWNFWIAFQEAAAKLLGPLESC